MQSFFNNHAGKETDRRTKATAIGPHPRYNSCVGVSRQPTYSVSACEQGCPARHTILSGHVSI